MDQLEGTLTGAIRAHRRGAVRSGGAARGVARFSRRRISFRHPRRDDRVRWHRSATSLDRLARDGRAGRVVREGRLVVISGRPNAGKSSLFNALARRCPRDRHRRPGHDARRADRARRHRRRAGDARGHGGPARRARRDRSRRRSPRARGAARRGADVAGPRSIDAAARRSRSRCCDRWPAPPSSSINKIDLARGVADRSDLGTRRSWSSCRLGADRRGPRRAAPAACRGADRSRRTARSAGDFERASPRACEDAREALGRGGSGARRGSDRGAGARRAGRTRDARSRRSPADGRRTICSSTSSRRSASESEFAT